jgi:hypothetical protein
MFKAIRALFSPRRPEPEKLIQFAIPLFASTDPIPAHAVAAAWKTIDPDLPPLEILSDDGIIASYRLEEAEFVVAFTPAPVPNDEALHAIETSWMWQESKEPVRTHRAHAIVTTTGTGDAPVDAWNLAFLCNAMLAAGRGVGVYWGSSCQVHSPSVMAAQLRDVTNPPYSLWVGITISGDSANGPFSAATHGLEALGQKEFEVLGARARMEDIRAILLDVIRYVIANGPVLQDGNTFGATMDAQWPVRHAPSALVPGRQAIVLGVP